MKLKINAIKYNRDFSCLEEKAGRRRIERLRGKKRRKERYHLKILSSQKRGGSRGVPLEPF
jgi:hypothetical protein